MDLVRIQLAGFHNFLDFGHRHPGRHGAQRVEVPRGFPVNEVPRAVGFPGLDQAKVHLDAPLQDILLTVETFGFLSLGQDRPVGGAGIKSRNSRPAGPQSFGQRPLGGQFDLQFPFQIQLFEIGVLTDIRGDHLADLACFQQQTEAKILDPGVVADRRELFDA